MRGVAALVGAGLAFGPTADAQELSVCLRGDVAAATVERVRQEFEAIGTTVWQGVSSAPSDCVTVALAEGPSLRATIHGSGVAPVQIAVPASEEDATAVFALRVVEAAHQGWLGRGREALAPSPAPLPTPRRRWALGVEGAGWFAPGGVGPVATPRLRLGYGSTLQASVVAGAPGLGGAFADASRGARLGLVEVGLGAGAEVVSAARIRVEIGLRASWLLLSGTLSQGDGVAFDQTSTVALFGLVGASGAIVGRLWWRAEFAWGATLSPLVVRIDDRLVAEWGRPLVVASGGVQWML